MAIELTPDFQKNYIRFNKFTTGSTDIPDMILSTLRAGDMSLQDTGGGQNRKKFFDLLGIDRERIAAVRQVHSQHVCITGRTRTFDYPEGDGLVTADEDTVLSITVADCVPIFLFSKKEKIFALLHSGWKGTGIALNALDVLDTEYAVSPAGISAVIGPSIGSCCYDVDRERAESFAGLWGSTCVKVRGDKYYLDLKLANKQILEDAGVGDIGIVSSCTCCDELFGSYRRQGSSGFTKMVALLGYFK